MLKIVLGASYVMNKFTWAKENWLIFGTPKALIG
jgi:hypothetical protein